MGRQTMVTSASCALVKGYASTVVNAVRARNVEGVKYASTVVDAVGARIVEGVEYVSHGSSTQLLQGMWRGINMRARSSTQ